MENFLKENYSPHIQSSVYPLFQFLYTDSYCKKYDNMSFDREYINLYDGGQISLDFSKHNDKSNKKTVVILHGILGGSESQYIRHFLKSCEKNNMNCVVIQQRGINDCKMLNPK